MKFDFKKFWILVIVFMVLVVPVAALKINDIIDISTQLGTSNAPVAHDMNIKLHSNKNYIGKLNATHIKTCEVTSSPKHGTLKLNKTSGKFVYVPNKNYVGTDSFKYKVNNGAKDSRIATVKVQVQNNPPTVTNLNYSVTSGRSYTLKFNGKDTDGDPLTYRNITKPLHGTLTINSNGTFNYYSRSWIHWTRKFQLHSK